MRHMHFHQPATPVRSILAMSLLTAAMLLAPATGALALDSLYTVQVALDPEDPDARTNAYQAALDQVLVRVTGVADPALEPQFAEMFPNPARFVLRFRPGEEGSLEVTLDGPAIETVLRQNGQTVWGAERPLTLVWLAVDWGQGVREIVAADDPTRPAAAARSIDRNRLLRERVQETALRRGVPVAFPLLDAEDLENVSFSDIWGGFDELLLQGSSRYGTESILVGRVRPDTLQQNRWTYYLGDRQWQWSGEPEEAIGLLAATLLEEYAIESSAPPETVTLNIAGVDSVVAYGSVQRLLEDLTQVEKLSLVSVTGTRMRYDVTVRGGAERLSRALQLSGILEPAAGIGVGMDPGQFPQFDTLDFVYRP